MNARNRRKDGFLGEYKLDQAYLQKPDVVNGRPGVVAGHSPDGTPVLVKEWLRGSSAKDGDLEQIWHHELRQLHRLAGYPGAAECIAHLHDAGFDKKGFYLAIAPGQRHPLQSILDNAGTNHWIKQFRTAGNRTRIWSNLRLLAFGLEALHSQGLLHRNLDAWAVLTAGGSDPDFQLTGFEWSMRIASVESATGKAKAASTALVSDSFLEDWKMFGLLAADLLGAKRTRLLDTAIAPYEIAEHLSVEESRLLRGIVQLQPLSPLNGETIAMRIDEILRGLAAEVASRQAKLHLTVRLGNGSPLSDRIRQASNLEIEADDIGAQLKFVIDDLTENPLLLAVKLKDSLDLQLLLRGRHLFYRLQEFRPLKATTTTWDFAYCERVADVAPAPVNLLGQRLLESESLEVMTTRDANEKFPKMRGKLSSWDDIRQGFEQASAPPSKEQMAHRALTLLQLLEALYAAADVFSVEFQTAPADVPSTENEGQLLCVTLSADPEREALSKALELQPPAIRFQKALENEGVASEGWILSEGRSAGERDPNDTEWLFQGIRSSDGNADLYLFAGSNGVPALRNPVLYVSSVGRDVQFRRRLKALKALKDHQELLRMMVDPRQRIVDSHDKLTENDAFDKLDPPKQDALRQLTSTLPLFLIQGPPGVGKTRLVRDLVQRRFSDEPTSRLLLTAQSNAAIDHLMDELDEVLQADAKDGPLVVRSTKKDAMESPSRFDIRVQSRHLIKRLAESDLVKEVPSRLRKSISDLVSASAGDGMAKSGPTAISGRAIEHAHRVFEGVVARAANVVFATTNSGELERLIDERGQFDWAIVEEAAKATGSELVSPLLLSHRRLMIGDHKQLPAFASDQLKKLLAQPARVQEAMRLGEEFIGRSLRDATTEDLLDEVEDDDKRFPALCSEALRLLTYFESAIEAEFQRQETRKSGRPIAKRLTAQHRMHPAIAQLVSRCFYGDLDTDPNCVKKFQTESRPFKSVALERLPMAPIVVIDMPYVQAKIKQKDGDCYPAWHNPMEVTAALEVLNLLRPSAPNKPPTLAVLSPYGQQRRRLANAVQEQIGERLAHLKEFRAASHSGQFCHTVDSFQGSEADVVVVSLVRNNHHSSVQKALGFLTDSRRMNVLLSRAKWQLVLIVSMDFLKEIIDAAKGSDDAVRIEFLQEMLEGLALGQKNGSVAKVPFEQLMKEAK